MAKQRSVLLIVAVCIGAVLLIVGATAFVVGGVAGFGWFGSVAEPVAPVLREGATLVDPVQWWGLAIAGVGALLLSGLLGFVLGRRRRPGAQKSADGGASRQGG